MHVLFFFLTFNERTTSSILFTLYPLKKPNPDESALITGIQSGGIQRKIAETKLYEQYFYLIGYGARNHSLREEECASVYSDAVIAVIDDIITDKFKGMSSLKTYIHQIFINKCVDAVRKKTTQKRRIHNDTVESDSLRTKLSDKARNVIEQLIEKEDRSFIMQKIKALDDKCRQLLLLFEDGLSDKEVAQMMQYNSAGVVKTSRHRCLEKLRKMINPTA